VKPRYSGDKSEEFWKRVGRLRVRSGYGEVYSLGCALQDLELRTLAALRNAERKSR
jgi:hypothetical protein